MHYNKFPNIGVCYANFPNLKGPAKKSLYAPSFKGLKQETMAGNAIKIVYWLIRGYPDSELVANILAKWKNWSQIQLTLAKVLARKYYHFVGPDLDPNCLTPRWKRKEIQHPKSKKRHNNKV